MPDVPGASSQSAHVGPWTVVLTSLGVAAFAAAWHFGLWMVVAAGLSAAGTLVHGDVSHRWWLESRLAAWALHAPHGRCPPQGLEGAISPDLAAISGGDLDVIDRGQRLVEADSRDPWQRAMASERLTAAADLVRAGAVPQLGDTSVVSDSPRQRPRPESPSFWSSAIPLVKSGLLSSFRPLSWLSALSGGTSTAAEYCVLR